MTWSPATDGVNVGLALPRSTSAIRLARRPSTCPLASTRYHLAALAASVVVAMNVRIALLRAVAGGAMSGPRPRSPLQAPYCTARGDRVSICGSDRTGLRGFPNGHVVGHPADVLGRQDSPAVEDDPAR